MFRLALSVLALMTVTSAVSAHEFWIEPQNYQVENGTILQADLKNGQNFKGIDLAFFENRFARFDMIQNGVVSPVAGRMGDSPALQQPVDGDGLLVIVHETTASRLTYTEWDKFQAFADHKGFGDMRARHEALGFPTDTFKETYFRYAKALVAVGAGAGQDEPSGMETEFVALTNPYTDALGGIMRVQVLYQGQPRINAQVEIFDRASDGTVTVTTTQTDASGIAQVPVTRGHSYLLDAVVLREAPKDSGTVWESLWAALTFAVPE